MHLQKTVTALVVLLPFLPIIQSCAGTATATRKSAMTKSIQEVDYKQKIENLNTALITIRYPAVIDPGAQQALYRAFEAHSLGGTVSDSARFTEKVESTVDSLMTKSNYFAMSLYHELQKRLPEHTVLLSPHTIVRDPGAVVTSRPLLASEEIPTALTVDFSVYSFPDPDEMMDADAITFGDTVTSLVSVHTAPAASPTTRGLLIVSEPLAGNAWAQSTEHVVKSFRKKYQGDVSSVNRPLDFLHFLSHGEEDDDAVPTESLSKGNSPTRVKTYELEKVRMGEEAMQQLAGDSPADPYAEAFASAAAVRILEELGMTDLHRATLSMRQTAVARFDPELAALFLAEEHESVRARLAKAELMLRAERDFLAVQSASIYQGVYRDVLGPEVRRLLLSEWQNLEERRSMARRQNAQTAIALLAAVGAAAAGGVGGGMAFSSPGAAVALAQAGQGLMTMSMVMMHQAHRNNANSKALGENFLVVMAPQLEETVAVQLDFLEGSEEISATSFPEFHQKAMAVYQQRARSIELDLPTDCAFRHPQSDMGGRWYGECVNGLASGSGRGVALFEGNRMIEYFGQAREGVASGVGVMIMDGGNLVYEGTFGGGVPHGAVLVTEPGRQPKARRFDNGKDVGSARHEAVLRAGI